MALTLQRRKRKLELQPSKVRLRLVQVAPALANGPTLGRGATALTLNFLPAWVMPGTSVVLGKADGSNAEVLVVQGVDQSANGVTLTPTSQLHEPWEGEYLTPAGHGRVPILGRVYWASREGLNGTTSQGRGFLEGHYGRLLKTEGPFGVTLPNGVGTDGILHRDRFYCTSKVNYHPGDEWIEVWRTGAETVAGDLLYVGTPVDPKIDEATIELNGLDALHAPKKQREGTAGWFVNAPRDVFEQFTKAAVVEVGDGFDDPTNFPLVTDASVPENLASQDGRWLYTNAQTSPLPGSVRLLSTVGSHVWSNLFSARTFAFGTGSANAYNRWRAEATVVLPTLGENTSNALYFGMLDAATETEWLTAIAVGGNISLNLNILVENRVVETVTVQQAGPAGTTGVAAGVHHLAIEGNGRWLYYFFDGVMVFSYPMLTGARLGQVLAQFIVGTPSYRDPNFYVDVEDVLLRSWQPYLMRSETDKGDYRLPGEPVPGGLQAVYFSDAALAARWPTEVGKRQMNPSTRGGLASQSGGTTAVFGERVDTAVAFAGRPGWEYPGLPAHRDYSVRWTGAVYLDLANYDYALTVDVEGGARLWVGKTRMGEQLLDLWRDVPAVFPEHEGYEYEHRTGFSPTGTSVEYRTPLGLMNARAHLGNESGWYPIIVEAQFGHAPSEQLENLMLLRYARSDQPELLVPMNTGPYPHLVLGAKPKEYFLLDGFDEPASITGSHQFFEGERQVQSGVAGPVPNGFASYLQPANYINPATGQAKPEVHPLDYPTANGTYFGSYPNWTIEVWARFDNAANGDPNTTAQVIFTKEHVWQLGVTGTGLLQVLAGAGSSWGINLTTAQVIPSTTWVHLAATYDGSVLRAYVDGALAGVSAPLAGQTGHGASNPAIGYWPGGAPGSQAIFTGRIAHLAFYDRALSEAELFAHFQGAQGQATLGGRPQVSAVPLSPQGILEQQVRNDSHFNQLAQFAENFGYQYTCKPEPLESGNFPGLLCPRVREGRDTDYVQDHDNTVAPALQMQADDVAEVEIVDAQGLADPHNSSQLYAEVFNFPELLAGDHAFVSSEYDSPGDIQTIPQLRQRASSLLALRAAPWTVLSGGGSGKRELTDAFPVTGNWTEFAWLPGDGIRYELPLLNLEDRTPRQIYEVQWQFFPDGIVTPTVAVLQRPKSLLDTMRRIQRESLDESRNYQGQLVVVTGSIGGRSYNTAVNPTDAPSTAATDAYTRLGLPTNMADVKSLTVVVQTLELEGGATLTLWIANGKSFADPGPAEISTGIQITQPGRYDITSWLVRQRGAQRTYARLAWNGTGRAYYDMHIEALVKV